MTLQPVEMICSMSHTWPSLINQPSWQSSTISSCLLFICSSLARSLWLALFACLLVCSCQSYRNGYMCKPSQSIQTEMLIGKDRMQPVKVRQRGEAQMIAWATTLAVRQSRSPRQERLKPYHGSRASAAVCLGLTTQMGAGTGL